MLNVLEKRILLNITISHFRLCVIIDTNTWNSSYRFLNRVWLYLAYSLILYNIFKVVVAITTYYTIGLAKWLGYDRYINGLLDR